MQETLNNTKEEYYKKFEMKAKSEKKAFVFGQRAVTTNEVGTPVVSTPVQNVVSNVATEIAKNVADVAESVAANSDEIVNEAETVIEDNIDISAE